MRRQDGPAVGAFDVNRSQGGGLRGMTSGLMTHGIAIRLSILFIDAGLILFHALHKAFGGFVHAVTAAGFKHDGDVHGMDIIKDLQRDKLSVHVGIERSQLGHYGVMNLRRHLPRIDVEIVYLGVILWHGDHL